MFIFIGVEDGSGVLIIVGIGMSSVVSLGFPGWVDLSVTAHGLPGSVVSIPGAVDFVFPGVTYVFPVRFSVRYAISILK